MYPAGVASVWRSFYGESPLPRCVFHGALHVLNFLHNTSVKATTIFLSFVLTHNLCAFDNTDRIRAFAVKGIVIGRLLAATEPCMMHR
jgi:hypothetical protein